MKIIEFDDAPDAPKKIVATPDTIGPIRTIEFDNEPSEVDPSAPERPSEWPAVSNKLANMKILDFAEDTNDKAKEAPRHKGIKIIEFD